VSSTKFGGTALELPSRGHGPEVATAKVCALKQMRETHSTLRQGSSYMQKHQAARMSRRTAVEHAVGMAETQGCQFETC